MKERKEGIKEGLKRKERKKQTNIQREAEIKEEGRKTIDSERKDGINNT